MTVTVGVVDDSDIMRKGLLALLGTDPGLEVVGQAGDGDEALALVRAYRPDVLLLDVRMPRRDGLSIVSEMMDLRNRALAQVAKADDFIVSDKLVSLMLAQLSENRALDRVFLAVGGLGGDQALGGGGAQLVGFDHGGSLARVQPLDSSFSA